MRTVFITGEGRGSIWDIVSSLLSNQGIQQTGPAFSLSTMYRLHGRPGC
jgi:hypothetical protein